VRIVATISRAGPWSARSDLYPDEVRTSDLVPAWLTRWRALALAVGVAGLVVWGLVAGAVVPAWAIDTGGTDHRDIELYTEIARRVATGGSYYQVAIPLQQQWDFPTTPAATVREPLEAWTIALLGSSGARILLIALLVGALVTLVIRLERCAENRFEWYASILLLVATVIAFVAPDAVYLHECWAMVFILLSLAARTDRRWWPAVLFALAAVLFRETAIVYPATMVVLALAQRRRAEIVGWVTGGAVWVAFYAWHLGQVAAAQVPDPKAAPSWVAFGGWPFIVSSVRFGTALGLGPYWLAALLVPLALVGWLFARGQLGLRVGLTAVAFSAAFLVVGRSINLYWGLLYAGALLPGLAFAPRGIAATIRALRSSGRGPATPAESRTQAP
jgi:hypothetical protein